jgi:hypothetical protein
VGKDAEVHTPAVHLRQTPTTHILHLGLKVRRGLHVVNIGGLGKREVFLQRDFPGDRQRIDFAVVHLQVGLGLVLCRSGTGKKFLPLQTTAN